MTGYDLEKKKIRVLLIEDDPDDIFLMKDLLETGGGALAEFELECVGRLKNGLLSLAKNSADIVLLDLTLPDSQGLQTFDRVAERFPQVPVIVLTGLIDEKLALAAVTRGAQDYLFKGELDARVFFRVIVHAIERKRVGEELTKSQAMLTEAQKIARLGSWEWEILPNKVTWSDELYDIFGIGPGSFEGNYDAFLNRVPPVDWDRVNQAVRHCLETGEPISYDFRIIREDGAIRHLHAEARAVRDEDGRVIRMLGTGQDITERKELERLRDEFISAVSHELRTPLAIIRGTVENLKDGIAGPLSEKQAGIIGTTSRNIDRLARIINDLLDLSRLESGRSIIHFQPLDVVSFLDETLVHFQGEAKNKGVALTQNIPAGLPAVTADPDLIAQVMNNLLNNALRFAQERIHVAATAESERDLAGEIRESVKISVADDGPGIPNDQREKIFEKFIQLNRPVGGSGYKGTGLGLAICKQIIDQHRGRIWVEGPSGEGSHFCFKLPLHRVSEQEP